METIILFAPLAGAIVCGFGWRLIGEAAAQWTATGLLFAAMVLSWIVFLGHDGGSEKIHIARWIESGSLSTSWALRVDRLTTIMLVVVTTVSALVHLYSFGYMAHDANFREGESYRPRFFAYLSFFTFAMLMLVTADNLLQMFFGWEGVGLASYLLIGFYFRKPSANAAAMKAFIVNRVGDFGFALGILAIFLLVDSTDLDIVFEAAPTLAETRLEFLWADWNAANLVATLLFVGAMGKSAQLLLHTWLPDAMEGPTPVSALIHAATMVTAGVFLVCRMSPLMEFAPETKTLVLAVGAATAFFAATVGLVQNDIKRVIAYSTCSQLGYMFAAAGAGVYSAAMFHLFTHAFFKALLFLGAGSVIRAMHHEQDMRNYGGLRRRIPATYWAMMIGTLAITGVGVPLTHAGFSGFLSKDAIIESAWAWGDAGAGGAAFWTLVFVAVLTSFYSWRLMFMTFHGAPRGAKSVHQGAGESPPSMLAPLGALAIGAVFAGMVWYQPFFGAHNRVAGFYGAPVHAGEHGDAAHDGNEAADPAPHADGEGRDGGEAEESESAAVEAEDGRGSEAGWRPGMGAIYVRPDNHVMEEAHEAPGWVKLSPFVAMLVGLAFAWLMYLRRPDWPARLAATMRPLYLFLLNKWYFDELFEFVATRPATIAGRFLWRKGDLGAIDGGVNGLAMGIVPYLARLAGRAQSGYIFTYAFFMVLGIVALVTWTTLAAGGE